MLVYERRWEARSRCNTLQHTHCNTLQHTHCNTLQLTHCNTMNAGGKHVADCQGLIYYLGSAGESLIKTSSIHQYPNQTSSIHQYPNQYLLNISVPAILQKRRVICKRDDLINTSSIHQYPNQYLLNISVPAILQKRRVFCKRDV